MPVLTKLDGYDYVKVPGAIRIKITSTRDPDIGDIMTELYDSDGNIFLDGYYYKYQEDYKFGKAGDYEYLELKVELV